MDDLLLQVCEVTQVTLVGHMVDHNNMTDVVRPYSFILPLLYYIEFTF